MSWDLMSYLSRAMSWAGGSDVGKSSHVDGSASAGAGTMQGTSTAHDLLGGMVGGFGGPMEWKGAGFGAQAGGRVSNRDGDFLGLNGGLGFGGGYSNWATTDGGAKLSGVSGAAGGIAPAGIQAGTKDIQGSASTNFYSGVGGSAYNYDGPGGTGVGLKANVVPLGAADTNLGLKTPLGDASAHADNMYLNKLSGSSTFGVDSKGVYGGQSQGSMLTGADGVKANLATPIGTWNAGAGSVTYGGKANLGGSYDPSTGKMTGNAGFNEGLNVKDLQTGYSTPGGDFEQHARAGSIFYGTQGSGTANWTPGKGLDGTFQGSGGGVNVKDIAVDGKLKGVGSYYGSLGEASNDTQITDGKFSVGRDSATIGASADGMGMRFNNGKFGGQLGSGPNALSGEAGFGSIGNNNSIKNASITANYSSLSDASLAAHADEVSYAGWTGSDMYAKFKGPGGVAGDVGLGHFGMDEIALKGADARIDKNGVSLGLEHGQYSGDINLRDFHSQIGTKDYYQKAALGEFATDKVSVDNAHLDASWDPRKGTHLSADKASYDEVLLKGVSSETHLGNYYDSKIGLGEGTFNHFDAKNIKAGVDLTNGVNASLTDGHYSFLGGKDLNVQQSIGGGAAGFGVSAKSASLGGVNADSLAFNSTLKSSHLDAKNLEAYGWKAEDQKVNANLGKLGLAGGADSVTLADLKVGNAHADTDWFGTKGNASVDNASLTAADIKGGHMGLGWGGTELLGAKADFNAGGGVEQAKANWNLFGGTADASFKNASVGAQLDNAHLNLFGHDLAIPDMGAKLNASGGANLDVLHGAASANLGLGGSSVNFAGHSFTVPDWVQAGAGVNLSQGAANVNLGGKNGVGADINLSQGEFGINAFGHHLDVAEGVRDVGGAISDGAHAVGGAVSDGAHAVGSAASSAWHSVTDW